MRNIFSVDVEDYFHPAEVSRNPSEWPGFADRVEIGTNLLLDLLAQHAFRATFFLLGWIAERHPGLVRRITLAGHEIGCHSHLHRLVFSLSPEEFRKDTRRAVNAIQDACGISPKVYRAPSCSITSKSLWALDILAELGFTHDSSIYPIVHDRYGVPGSLRHAHKFDTPSGPILEIPIATVRLARGQVAPVGGGAYLRLFPYRYISAGIRRINRLEQQPACIYIHPWELDQQQPRIAKKLISRVRTYAGLPTVGGKLNRLFGEFAFGSIGEIYPFGHNGGKQGPQPAEADGKENCRVTGCVRHDRSD